MSRTARVGGERQWAGWPVGWPVALPTLAVGGLLCGMGWIAGSEGGWWWLVAAPMLGIGAILIVAGCLGLFTPWLWLKVDVRSPNSPRIRFSLPLPLRWAEWGLRLAGPRTEGLVPIVRALGDGGARIDVEVDEPETGEHVAVSVRRIGERTMTTSEERVKILKMVEDGKLKPDEAAQLLSALGRGERKREVESSDADSRWLRVRVTDLATGKQKVNINVPMRLVGVGMRVGARFVPDVEGVDTKDLFQALQEGMTGKILDVVDEEDNERVEIFAE